jgi:hypothetical protein
MLIYTLQCAASVLAIGAIPFAAVTAFGWLSRKGA